MVWLTCDDGGAMGPPTIYFPLPLPYGFPHFHANARLGPLGKFELFVFSLTGPRKDVGHLLACSRRLWISGTIDTVGFHIARARRECGFFGQSVADRALGVRRISLLFRASLRRSVDSSSLFDSMPPSPAPFLQIIPPPPLLVTAGRQAERFEAAVRCSFRSLASRASRLI